MPGFPVGSLRRNDAVTYRKKKTSSHGGHTESHGSETIPSVAAFALIRLGEHDREARLSEQPGFWAAGPMLHHIGHSSRKKCQTDKRIS
jgi:hypothetical protein